MWLLVFRHKHKVTDSLEEYVPILVNEVLQCNVEQLCTVLEQTGHEVPRIAAGVEEVLSVTMHEHVQVLFTIPVFRLNR